MPGKSHGWRSLVGCSPWGCCKSDTTEWLHFHFSLSCIGEGNGNPLRCSCLENPRDRGAWWAAVYGVAQSGTGLKRLSSSSSSLSKILECLTHKTAYFRCYLLELFFFFWSQPRAHEFSCKNLDQSYIVGEKVKQLWSAKLSRLPEYCSGPFILVLDSGLQSFHCLISVWPSFIKS